MTLLQTKAMLVSGLALWLSLAVANNILDPRTNITLLRQMMGMEELQRDGVLGQGLLWKAVRAPFAAPALLTCVIVCQLVIAALLWRGGYLLAFGPDPVAAIDSARLALSAFAALWLFFLCGGMWFGYWIKLPQPQMVHLTLLVISIGALVLIHL